MTSQFNPSPGDLVCDVMITHVNKSVIKVESAGGSVQLNVREARLLAKWLKIALPKTQPLVR